MSKYINADEFRKIVKDKQDTSMEFDDDWYAYDNVIEMLDEMPSADVVEAKYGYWKPLNNDPVNHPMVSLCSECRYISYMRTDFCPNCGADMRGETE